LLGNVTGSAHGAWDKLGADKMAHDLSGMMHKVSGDKMAHELSGMLDKVATGEVAHDLSGMLGKVSGDKVAHDLTGMLGQAKDAVNGHGGQGLLDRVSGMTDHAYLMGSHGVDWVEQHVPGAALLIDEAKSLWKSDVPGGFQLGHTVDIAESTIPGVRGFVMQSTPDGGEYFVAEDFGSFDCCCFWMGRGPTYHIIEGNPIHGTEVLMMQSHRSFCCSTPELEVLTPSGEVVAAAEEHAVCCCFAHTRVDVRGSEVYRLTGNLFGALFSCCTSEHSIEDHDGKSVGRVVHWNSGAHIQFPETALASHKAALLAATFLTDLRRR